MLIVSQVLKAGLVFLALATQVVHAQPREISRTECQIPRETVSAGQLQEEVARFQVLAEETLSRRAQALEFLAHLKEREANKEPLSGQDLLTLNRGYAEMLDVRARLWAASTQHECWLSWTPATPEEDRVKHTGVMLSLAASLMLYDNYSLAIAPYRNEGVLRRLMNNPDSGFDIRRQALDKIYLSTVSPFNRQRVRAGLTWFEKDRNKQITGVPAGYDYVVTLVEQSPAYHAVRKLDVLGYLGKLVGYVTTYGFDTALETTSLTTYVPSLVFGNAVGLVETRKGKLYGDADVLATAAPQLVAGDILLEKTPFRLTDKFIPGHWGHAAIWVGTADELKALGIWEDPVVVPYQAQILAGKSVVEALRTGVKMNSFAHFLNVDDLAVLRQRALTPALRAEIILQTLRQVGKSYDFNFDVETTDKIVCSELVYHAYAHVQWPTSKVAGRVTITPDDIAQKSLNGALVPLLAYHDGQRIQDPVLFMETALNPEKRSK